MQGVIDPCFKGISPYPVSGGQLLHAYRIGFVHPVTGEEMLFEAEPEERFTKWVEKLRIR